MTTGRINLEILPKSPDKTLTKDAVETRVEKEYSFEGNEWEMVTDLKYIPLAVNKIEDKLKKGGWDEDSNDFYAVESSFSEILWNAVVHGNLGIHSHQINKKEEEAWTDVASKILEKNPEIRKKKVRISIEINEKQAKIIIRDEGAGFNIKSTRNPTTDKTKFKPTGRGIFHARHFLDEVTFDSSNGTAVTMVKNRTSKT